MKSNYLLILILVIVIYNNLFSQHINNTLGASGSFKIKDASTDFFTLHQSSGIILLPEAAEGSDRGTIYKGNFRFLHTFRANNTYGHNLFLGLNSGNNTLGGDIDSDGSYNTGVGSTTLTNITSGASNSAFGVAALFNNTTGIRNDAFGSQSLHENTTGEFNSGFGTTALFYNNGSSNSAFGYRSLFENSSGNFNVAVGREAGNNITTGSNNIVIGYNTVVPTGTSNNQIRIGNSSITYAGVQVPWTTTSDRKWKENIETTSLGLDFISKLNPVSYIRNNDEKQRTEFGLIAQEVEEILNDFNIKNSGMLIIDDNGNYELRYNDILSPMIKAIQELKTEKDNEIAKLKMENDDLRVKLEKLEEIQNLLIKEFANLKSNINENLKVSIGEK